LEFVFEREPSWSLGIIERGAWFRDEHLRFKDGLGLEEGMGK